MRSSAYVKAWQGRRLTPSVGRRLLGRWNDIAHTRNVCQGNQRLYSTSQETAERQLHNPSIQTTPSKVIFSGIQPTGIPHLGNYLGALQNWVELQKEAINTNSKDELYFSIVGLHALTVPNQPKELFKGRKEMMAMRGKAVHQVGPVLA